MYLARSSPTVLTWFMDASASGLQRPHSGTPRPPGASTPSGPGGALYLAQEACRVSEAEPDRPRSARGRPDRAHLVHGGVVLRPRLAAAVPGEAQQGRGR